MEQLNPGKALNEHMQPLISRGTNNAADGYAGSRSRLSDHLKKIGRQSDTHLSRL